ncbi:MAG: hypothetical protein AAB897_00220 [Patescibacteria group bacterium]
MPSLLILNNIHLGIELFGAIVFFIIGWLFAGAYRIKKDLFSFGRTLGFFSLFVWQILHSIYGGELDLMTSIFYVAGLALLCTSYAAEQLPPRPKNFTAIAGSAAFSFLSFSPKLAAGLLGLLTIFLAKRYIKDIDKLIKWLLLGFFFLAVSSLFAILYGNEEAGAAWIIEHTLKTTGFTAIAVWGWQWLSMRLREEMLIVFVGSSLFIALIVTTVFSTFFVDRLEKETLDTLSSNARVLHFYIDSLKNKSLASAQIAANTEDFASAFGEKNFADLDKVSRELILQTEQQFLIAARTSGEVVFKLNLPIKENENILKSKIGAYALEGKPANTIDYLEEGQLAVQAAAPIFYKGSIVGALITGNFIDDAFANDFKKISKLETSVFAEGRPIASTFFRPEETMTQETESDLGGGEFIGKANISKYSVIGAFLPIENIDQQSVGIVAITTTPEKLIKDSQSANRAILLVIFIVVMILILPLYRFALFISS